MAQPLIEDICNKVANQRLYWETVTATTTTGVTTWTLTRTGRTACVITLPPPAGTSVQSPLIAEATLCKIALAIEEYFMTTQPQ